MDRMDSRIEKFRGHAEACEALVFITEHHDARQQLLDIAKQWRDLMIRAEMIQQLARLEWGDPADLSTSTVSDGEIRDCSCFLCGEN
jgi:hypothetical protein